jgi:cell division protein ZapA
MQLAQVQADLAALKDAPKPAAEKVEVPVIPTSVTESLAEIAARAESMADAIEEKAAG